MQRIPVESTDLVSIGYDPKSRVLEIEFKEDRIYQYLDVEPNVYDLFMRADSYGEYFFASINKHYRYKRIERGGKDSAPEAVAFITGNSRKIRDLQIACEPFGISIEGLELPVDEIQSHDPEEIAVKKAKQAYKLATRPVVINDVYWNILALKGFPGAYMSYVAGWFKAEDFLALMADKKDRTILCTDTLAYYDGTRIKTFAKTYTGNIIEMPRGKGASIDQILTLEGQDRTVAEVENEHGRSTIDPHQTIWHDFAKWYSLQLRLGKV